MYYLYKLVVIYKPQIYIIYIYITANTRYFTTQPLDYKTEYLKSSKQSLIFSTIIYPF